MIGKQVEDRRHFYSYEKKDILKRSNSVCACCGKKLTVATMTIDHIIPLSRGGTNDISNLISLCYDCNQDKGNFLYIPECIYLYMFKNKELDVINKMFWEWFKTVKDEFDFSMFPLISPRSNFILIPSNIQATSKTWKSIPIQKSLVFSWNIVGKEIIPEIEAVTDLCIKDERRNMNILAGTRSHAVAIYSLRKLTTDKIISVVAVLYSSEYKSVTFGLLWNEAPNSYKYSIFENIISRTLDTLLEAGNTINRYYIAAYDKDVVNYFMEYRPPYGKKYYIVGKNESPIPAIDVIINGHWFGEV